MGLLFTYFCTYGGALASLFSPFVGLLIYVCFAIVKPESLWYWSVPAGNYSRIIAIALLVGWFINGMGNWNLGRSRGILLALLAYLGWSCVSAAVSDNPTVGFAFVESLSKIVLPFVVGLTLIDSVAKLRQLAWTIMLSQGYVAFTLNESFYQGYNRLHEIGFGDMDNNCVAIAMVAGAGLAFFLGLHEEKLWKKLLAFLCAGLMAHSIMFAFSRGGMLGLIIVGMVSFVLIPKKPAHYAVFALAILLGVRLAGPEVLNRFSSTFADQKERDESAQSRLDMWKICVDIMIAEPIVGIGPDHFTINARKYGLAQGKEAHTLWLQIGAELGFPGLAAILTFYFLCMARCWPLRHAVPGDDPFIADSARMIIAGLSGFLVSAQFVSLEGLELPYYIVLIGAGTLKLTSQLQPAHQPLPATEAAFWPAVPAS